MNPPANQPLHDIDRDRALGALVGLAVGDALGTTLEFQRLPHAPFSPPLSGPHREITGGGPFRVARGQVTDDTQMATALARSLRTHGDFVLDDVARRYVAWSREAFDIGNQTAQALARVATGTPPTLAGREVWIANGSRMAGNGSLMRTAPLGVFFAHDAERRVETSLADSDITHYDPRCALACAAFNGAIAAAARERADSRAMLAAAHADLALAYAQAHRDAPHDAKVIDDALARLSDDLAAAEGDDPHLDGTAAPDVDLTRYAGFVRVAFRLAFWHLLHAPSFEVALVDTVNRGGDADTNGAIVGALLGARYGAAAIPARWHDAVRDALTGQTDPWATDYHPRELFALIPAA